MVKKVQIIVNHAEELTEENNMYIPDPTEILESQMEDQFDLVDKDNKYPCYYCGEKFDVDTMHTISAHPASPLECGRETCSQETTSE